MVRLGRESLDRSSALLDLDPPPFIVENSFTESPFVLLCDHAGRAEPRNLSLGVPESEMDRHIAWDIGAGELCLALAKVVDAGVVRQPYSRLVIDCNRSPDRPDAMPEVSDGTHIPANRGLDAQARAWRIAAIHEPYHARISALLDARGAAGLRSVLVFMHSFTPSMAGIDRPWRFGILHTGQPFALAVLERLRECDIGPVGDNQPYVMDETDYTAGRHGVSRGLDFVEIEVRQDLIAGPEGRAEVAALFARALPAALADIDHR